MLIQLNLRNTLYEFFRRASRKNAIYRRWRWQESKNNLKSELVLSESEWTREWDNVLAISSPRPSSASSQRQENLSDTTSQQEVYESLESIHVFALAHILKRPIIIVSDTVLKNASGEELSPISFGGIYLPLEVPPERCHRSPLILSYDASHFSPLVAMRQPLYSTSISLRAIPIVDQNRQLLPLQFSIDPGPDFTWFREYEDNHIASEIDALQTDDRKLDLIYRYMDIVRMDLRKGVVKKTSFPLRSPYGSPEFIPSKFLTLSTAGINSSKPNHHSSGIFKEIKMHLKRFGWKNRRNSAGYKQLSFSSEELLQSNCVLCVLLHSYQHQHMDSMLERYISDAKERFRSQGMTPGSLTPKKIRISHSFTNSPVNLKCLYCPMIASPSMNFLCEHCFDKQQREFLTDVTSKVNGRRYSPSQTEPLERICHQEPQLLSFFSPELSSSDRFYNRRRKPSYELSTMTSIMNEFAI